VSPGGRDITTTIDVWPSFHSNRQMNPCELCSLIVFPSESGPGLARTTISTGCVVVCSVTTIQLRCSATRLSLIGVAATGTKPSRPNAARRATRSAVPTTADP